MRRFLILATSALACGLALACADRQQSPTAPAADLPAPSFGVERGTAPFGFGFGDDKFIVFVGATVEELVSFFCTGAEIDVDFVNQLVVTRPDGSLKQQLKGNETAVVVDLAAFNESFCQNPSAVPTFTGTARVMVNDNDVFVSGSRANASQVHVVGRVTDENGQLYQLVAFAQQVLAPGHPAPDVVVQHSEVQVHLKAIGQ